MTPTPEQLAAAEKIETLADAIFANTATPKPISHESLAKITAYLNPLVPPGTIIVMNNRQEIETIRSITWSESRRKDAEDRLEIAEQENKIRKEANDLLRAEINQAQTQRDAAREQVIIATTALRNIIRHMEIVGGKMAGLSSVVAIASRAIAEIEVKALRAAGETGEKEANDAH